MGVTGTAGVAVSLNCEAERRIMPDGTASRMEERIMELTRRNTLVAMAGLGAGLILPCRPAMAADDPWADLRTDIFGDRALLENTGVIALEAPYRAEDAALVPMTMTIDTTKLGGASVKAITLVIDENPAPLAAVFRLGETAGITRISTRVRVNAYTKVHAVAETSDGKLHVVEKFVKASGGCSAPAGKDPAEALASLGKMKLKQFTAASGKREAQLMLRHPNNSGFQMDQVTRLYVPARFIRDLTVRQGGDVLLKVEGGISLSEDPNIRFDYLPNGAATFSVEAIDTDNAAFKAEFPVDANPASPS
jgi:sulfur-oxidizing protein SoxY